jgi:hypothetical protein
MKKFAIDLDLFANEMAEELTDVNDQLFAIVEVTAKAVEAVEVWRKVVNVALDQSSRSVDTRVSDLSHDAAKTYSRFVQAIQAEQERRRTPFGKR